VLALQAAVIVMVVTAEHAARRADQAMAASQPTPDEFWHENRAKATLRPPTIEAKDARLRPDELVIGVQVGNEARAYRLAAFDYPSGHLVNDLIGRVPVSVAYCNLTHCVRVYTDPRNSAPLDAKVAGLLNGHMVMNLSGALYFQDSGRPVEPAKNPPPIPYDVLTPTLTTWKEWTRLHRETDIFVGGDARRPE
jgi:hypothetical protein